MEIIGLKLISMALIATLAAFWWRPLFWSSGEVKLDFVARNVSSSLHDNIGLVAHYNQKG